MSKLLTICGPTATGKTKLAVALAERLNGELVSADSQQVYKGLEYLTGKDRQDLRETKIWLCDVVDVKEKFSVAQYHELAMRIIADIQRRKKLPIVVGGTGLYIKSITNPLPLIHIPQNLEVRAAYEHQPKEFLQHKLQDIDSQKWERMNNSDRHNPRRLIRAIEIALSDKHVHADWTPEDVLQIGLSIPLDILEKRIRDRVESRWSHALEEVQAIPPDIRSTRTILGMKEISEFLSGHTTADEAKRRWALSEFQYAKRQLTWFKKQKDIHWLGSASVNLVDDALQIVRSWYTDSI